MCEINCHALMTAETTSGIAGAHVYGTLVQDQYNMGVGHRPLPLQGAAAACGRASSGCWLMPGSNE